MNIFFVALFLSVFCLTFVESQPYLNNYAARLQRRQRLRNNLGGIEGNVLGGNAYAEPPAIGNQGLGAIPEGGAIPQRELASVDYFSRQMPISQATNSLLGQGVMCSLASGRLLGSQHTLVDRKFSLSPERGIIIGFVYCDEQNNIYDAYNDALIAVSLPGKPTHAQLTTFVTSDTRFTRYGPSKIVRRIEQLVHALELKGVCIAYCGVSIEDGNPVVADCSGNAYSGIAYVHAVDGIPLVFNRLDGKVVGPLERISQLAAKRSYLSSVVSSIPALHGQLDVIASLNNGFVPVAYPADTILTNGHLSARFETSILERQREYSPFSGQSARGFNVNDLLRGAFGRFSTFGSQRGLLGQRQRRQRFRQRQQFRNRRW